MTRNQITMMGVSCLIVGYVVGNFLSIESITGSGDGKSRDAVTAQGEDDVATATDLIPIEELEKSVEEKSANNLESLLENPQDISIMELKDVIETNVAIAEDDYVGKPYRVRGDIKHMLGNTSDSYTVTVLPTGTDQRLTIIDTFLSFPNLPRDIQRSFRRGQSISATCILQDVERGKIYFDPCKLN